MEKMNAFYKFASIVVPPFYKLLFRLTITGKENIPAEGPFIVASNHYSNWDPIMVDIAFLPFPLKIMAKKELFKNKILGSLIRAGGAFPVDRGLMKASTFKEIDKIFNKKGGMVMFPQGTRSKKRPNAKPKKGTAYLSIKYQVPVVPVHIQWPDTPTKVVLKRKKVVVYIKKPLFPPEELTDENVEKFTYKIFNSIINIV